MPSKYSWTTSDGLTRHGGPRTAETTRQEKAIDKEIGNLVPVSGSIVYKEPDTGSLSAAGIPFNTGSAGLSAVSYDGSNRAIAFTLGGINYTVSYGGSSITITGSNSTSTVVSLDGSGRISGVA